MNAQDPRFRDFLMKALRPFTEEWSHVLPKQCDSLATGAYDQLERSMKMVESMCAK
jgi:hypothetical protein